MRYFYGLFAVVLFLTCVAPPADGQRSSQLTRADVERMIAEFGPIVYLRADERYLMDEPEFVLDKGVSLEWGIVENAGSYGAFQCRKVETLATSSKNLMQDVRLVKETIASYPEASKYKYWLRIHDDMKGGSMRRAKAQVRVLPATPFTTELQFWFFYPFNGPGRVEVCASSKMCDDNWLSQAGRHYGDWELVSLLVSNTSRRVISVYMSRHSGEDVFDRTDTGVFRSTKNPRKTLEMRDSHPVVYAGIFSHAHYPHPGNHNYERVFGKKYGLGTASADLFDRTAAGIEFRAYERNRHRIISSALEGFPVAEPEWLEFDGNWGQYERLSDRIKWSKANIPVYTYSKIGSGPSGPKRKKEWNGCFGAASRR